MFEKIKKLMKTKYALVFNEDATDFTDFCGKVRNDKGEPFDIEGSLEWFSDDNQLAYSISFFDIKRKKEYDGMIGTITLNAENNIEDVLSIVFEPNFELCS